LIAPRNDCLTLSATKRPICLAGLYITRFAYQLDGRGRGEQREELRAIKKLVYRRLMHARAVYRVCGILSLGLAVAGAALPILPTTPFVLLAAFCFSKSNPPWHASLKNSRSFGTLIHDWEEHRSISTRAKLSATAAMAVAAACMWIYAATDLAVGVFVTAVQAGVLAFIWTRPSKSRGRRPRHSPPISECGP